MRGCKRFMTKVKLRDATKELLKDAKAALDHVSAMRKNASELAQAARKLETQFVREEEQQRAKAEQAEQERLARQHTKAFTMPDNDEPEAPKAEEAVAVARIADRTLDRVARAERVAANLLLRDCFV